MIRRFAVAFFLILSIAIAVESSAAQMSTDVPGRGSRIVLERMVGERTDDSYETNLKESTAEPSRPWLFSDSLPPNGSRTYAVNVLEHSLLILTLKIDSGQSAMDVKVSESQTDKTVERCYVPEISESHIYYAVNQGELRVELINKRAERVEYALLIDATEPLGALCAKAVPLAGGLVGFHVDMNRDDVLLLALDRSAQESFVIKAYAPYYRITNAVAGYMLRSHTDESRSTLSFTADLGGRYYILVKSANLEREFSVTCEVHSPYWNRWWFWPALCILLFVTVTAWASTKIRYLGDLGKLQLSIAIGDYCVLVTLCLWSSSIGAYLYRNPFVTVFFRLSLLSLGLGLGLRAYADWLKVKVTKKVANTWYLTMVSSGILSFLACYVVIGFDFTEWWGGIGSVAGGIGALTANSSADRRKAASHMAFGALLFLLFPTLVSIFRETVFQPFVIELYAPELGSYIFRVASPYQTLAQGFILSFAVIALGMTVLLLRELRNLGYART